MKAHILILLALTGLAPACARKRDPSPSLPPGSALSVDGKFTYTVDADNDVLTVVNRKTKKKIAEVPVGKTPEAVTVAPDETVYVANRGSRSVSIIHREPWREVERVRAGLEPIAVAVSPDNKLLYVVNGSSINEPDSGTFMAVDLSTREVRWELPVKGSPKTLRLVDGRAHIELHESGTFEVDLKAAPAETETKPHAFKPTRAAASIDAWLARSR